MAKIAGSMDFKYWFAQIILRRTATSFAQSIPEEYQYAPLLSDLLVNKMGLETIRLMQPSAGLFEQRPDS